jgi:hypothetical protein
LNPVDPWDDKREARDYASGDQEFPACLVLHYNLPLLSYDSVFYDTVYLSLWNLRACKRLRFACPCGRKELVITLRGRPSRKARGLRGYLGVSLGTILREAVAGIRYDPHDPRRSDVDLWRREITVRGKSGRPRVVRIGHEAARAVDWYPRARSRHGQAWRLLWLGVNKRGR